MDNSLKLFNSMIVHGMSPEDLNCGTMIPIPKNRHDKVNESDDFRAICLQSVLCKIMDLLIIKRESAQFCTSEMQFGFRDKHSASLATSVVLETVDCYCSNGGVVYGLALEATKAFNRVKYDKLFNVLVTKKENPLYIRLLSNMYFNLIIIFFLSKQLSPYTHKS